jgi:hypothetical protein
MTGFACPRMDTVRMKFGILVQRNGMRSMGRAEDMATVTTMMFADKEIE